MMHCDNQRSFSAPRCRDSRDCIGQRSVLRMTRQGYTFFDWDEPSRAIQRQPGYVSTLEGQDREQGRPVGHTHPEGVWWFQVELGPDVLGGSSTQPVEDVVVPLLLALLADPGFLQQVVGHEASHHSILSDTTTHVQLASELGSNTTVNNVQYLKMQSGLLISNHTFIKYIIRIAFFYFTGTMEQTQVSKLISTHLALEASQSRHKVF